MSPSGDFSGHLPWLLTSFQMGDHIRFADWRSCLWGGSGMSLRAAALQNQLTGQTPEQHQLALRGVCHPRGQGVSESEPKLRHPLRGPHGYGYSLLLWKDAGQGSQDPAQPLPTVSAHLVTSHMSRRGCQWHCRALPKGSGHKDHDSYTLPSLAPGLVLKERSTIPTAWPTTDSKPQGASLPRARRFW